MPGWIIRQVPYRRDRRAPPLGLAAALRRAWMRLRWRWVTMPPRGARGARRGW
jgi:hypothetical protein